MSTAFEERRRPRTPDATAEPHGPGRPGPLRPGERASVLIVSPGPDHEEALRHAMSWITAFEDDCGPVLEHDETALYAVGLARDICPDARGVDEDDATDPSAFIHAVLLDGRWVLRGEQRVAQEGEAAAWAEAYRRAVTAAGPDALCTVWDVYPLPAAGC